MTQHDEPLFEFAELIPDAILFVDVSGRIRYANGEVVTMFGYARAELYEQPVHRLLPEELRARHREHLSGYFASRQQRRPMTGDLDLYGLRKSGERFPVEIALHPARVGGELLAVAAIRDVTERRRVEREAREHSENLRTLMELARVGMWQLATGSDRRSYSSQLLALLGQSEAHANSDDFYAAVHPDDRMAVSAATAAALREGKPYQIRLRMRCADGAWRWFETRAFPERDSEGRVCRLRGLTVDVTQQAMVEEALREAQRSAEAASRAKGDFLAMMSHEIRTPLNAVIGMASLLVDTALSPAQRELAETIQSSGKSLLAILNDILDFTKVEMGRIDLEEAEFDLLVLLDEAVTLFAENAYRKGIELVLWVDAGVPSIVCGDPGRLRQILLNLIGNAVKFTHRGEVLVRVERGGAPGEGVCELRFVVRDTGVGIPASAHATLFKPFSQADSSTTRRYGGTGLGLAICGRLAELMGASLGFESSPGEGSTFKLQVSLGVPPGREVETARDRALDGRRLLLVEDNETVGRYVESLAARWGATIVCARRGAEAFCAARQGFDAVLIDHSLPDMDGMTVARRLRSEFSISRPVLVFFAPCRPEESIEDFCRNEVDACLRKPFSESRLRRKLSSLFAARSASLRVQRFSNTPSVYRPRREFSAARVLVVEDNPVNQKVIVRMLESVRCQVEVAHHGIEALEATERGAYGLIFMDCQMPEMDGYEATRAIRQREQVRGGRTPIVAMTANALSGDRERCLDAGMDDFLAKPIVRASLDAVLARWIRSDE